MTLRNQLFWFVAETLISFYQNNECLWNYNIPEYHTNSNKDLLWIALLKSWRISIPKRTFKESGRACSRSVGTNTEKSKRNHPVQVPVTCIGLHGSFTLIFSSPTAFAMTQRTLSTRYPVPHQPKKERKNDMTLKTRN